MENKKKERTSKNDYYEETAETTCIRCGKRLEDYERNLYGGYCNECRLLLERIEEE